MVFVAIVSLAQVGKLKRNVAGCVLGMIESPAFTTLLLLVAQLDRLLGRLGGFMSASLRELLLLSQIQDVELGIGVSQLFFQYLDSFHELFHTPLTVIAICSVHRLGRRSIADQVELRSRLERR